MSPATSLSMPSWSRCSRMAAIARPVARHASFRCRYPPFSSSRPVRPGRASDAPPPLGLLPVRPYSSGRIIPINVPQMPESIKEGTVRWSKSVGDQVEQDEEVASLETDKVDIAVNAPEAGVITEILAEEESTVVVDQLLAKLEAGAAAESSSAPDAGSEGPKEDQSAPASRQPETRQPETKPESKPAPAPAPAPAPEKKKSEPNPQQQQKQQKQAAPSSDSPAIGGRGERIVKMNRIRLRIAERLKQSQNTAASLTTFQEVDMSALMAFRARYKQEVLDTTGVKLGFMSAFSRAGVLAMRDLPVVNAAIDEKGENIVYHDYVDISVAVATEKGLVTPVIRNVEAMDMISIERSIAELGKKARDNKLTIEDMAGGTFTISNGGVFGSLMGTPIINLPQTAVLGLHATKDRPVAVNGQVVIRPMMYLALTYDHRLLDGREAVQFLVKVKQYIEDPAKMLL